MNTPHEHTSDDSAVISRLRSALDEVTAEPVSARAVTVTAGRGSLGAARWLAIAAALALVGGGITAIVVNRNQHTATPTDSTPVTPPVPTEPTLVRTVVPWFVLNSPDLQRGEEQFEECCDPNARLVMAWRHVDQFLTMTEVIGEQAAPDDNGRTVVEIDGGVLLFDSVGLTDDERDLLARAVVRGSGLPYVLPMEGWAMVGFGYVDSGSQRSQLYTALNQPPESSLLPTVTITVGEYRGELEWLAASTEVVPITIAGYDGWKVTDDDGGVIVLWTTDDGSWATLQVHPALAERADGLIAAVSEVPQGDDPSVDGGPAPVVETVPVPLDRRYQGVASVIDTGNGPMIAFSFMDSLPPQGGDLPLAGFDWDMIDGEQSVNGTTWSDGPILFTGTFDGTTFTLTEPATSGEGIEWPTGPTYGTVTPDCTDGDLAPDMEVLSTLDYAALHIISSGDYRWDGHCGVQVHAMFDTPELRAALAPLGDQVTVTIAFVDITD